MATKPRRINGKPEIHRKPVGAKRGRPATGRTTEVVSLRLRASQATELKRRAKGIGMSPSAFAALTLERELKTRPNPTQRARARTRTR